MSFPLPLNFLFYDRERPGAIRGRNGLTGHSIKCYSPFYINGIDEFPNRNRYLAMARKEIADPRRLQILEATILSIARRGFEKTTCAGVAKELNLSFDLVSHYFPSKKILLTETLRHMALEYEASWRQKVYRHSTPAARLDAMIDADFDIIMSDRDGAIVWYGFWCEAQWRPELLHICEKLSNAYYEQAWTAMRQLVEEGGYRDMDPAELAHALNAMINGLWLEILVNPNGCDVDLARRAARSFLARAFPKEFGAAKALSSAA